MHTVPSPSDDLKAVVFIRDCGATTGFSTQVSIISAAETLPNRSGNALVLDDDVSLLVQWPSDSMLLLSGLGLAKIYKQERSVSGVAIGYVH